MDKRNSTYRNNELEAKIRAQTLCFSAAFRRSFEPLKHAYRVASNFYGFSNYLKLAREVAMRKETSRASYKIVDKNKEYILSSWISFTVSSKIVNGKLVTEQESFYEKLAVVGIEPQEIDVETVHINGSLVNPIKINDYYFVEGKISDTVLVNNNPNIIVSKEKYTPSSVLYNNTRIPSIGGKVSIENYISDYCKDENIPQIVFKLEKQATGSRSNFLILELEDNPNAEESIYDVFFTDEATEVYFSSRKDKYRIVKKDKEYGRITIDPDGHRIPDEGIVSLSVNVSQLSKQFDAVQGLMYRPADYQKPLLNLTESYDFNDGKGGLDTFEYDDTYISYKILTESERDGVEKQREFVKKALQTPDFMILQGPPGSGKTTAILELIYQLNKLGHRVLLCASTHVAIDNVLEKIITHPNSKDLLDVIHPIRVGDEDNVYSEPVKPFIFDSALENVPKDFKELATDSFNLVCGTTIGVLRYPPLAKMLDEAKVSTTKPLFDYMIIDEASKTTFSEFLVPAATAERWIIVGDVKQLAPYVEKNDLKPALLECSALNEESKRISLSFIRELENNNLRQKMKNHVYIVGLDTIRYIDQGLDESNKNTNILAVTNATLSNMFVIGESDLDNNSPRKAVLSTKGNIIFVENHLAFKVFKYLAKEDTVLDEKEDISSPKNFNKYKVLHFRKMFSQTDYRNYKSEYPDFAKTRDVANEILWRLIRLYELNDDQIKSYFYKKYLDSIASSIKDEGEKKSFKETLETLQGIAIPSVIMMLQEGIKSSAIKKHNRIFGGLTAEEKKNRFVMLDYQHRMHPDISTVSRKNVYNEEALKDYTKWKSSINNYPSAVSCRFEIRDVQSDEPVGKNNFNKAEVRAVINELLSFLEFAKENKKEKDKKYEIAILSFYNHQVYGLRKELQKIFKSPSLFNFYNDEVHVSLNSVDRFQGQEADIVYLSMVQDSRLGFLDSISRINVAITRAKEKIIIFGNKTFFSSKQNESEFLRDIFNRR